MKTTSFQVKQKIALAAGIILLHTGCDSSNSVEGAGQAVGGTTETTTPTPTATVKVSSTSSSPTATPTTAATTTLTDVMRIVSYGEGINFNNQTGGPNDVALNPSTLLPAAIYYDKSAPISGSSVVGGLKYAYMDSTGNWNIEVVDANSGTSGACGTAPSTCVGAANATASGANVADIMALAFTSSGTPVIAYVYGGSAATNKAVKIAERSSSGTWSYSQVTYASYASVTTSNDPIKALTLTVDSSNRLHVTFAFYNNAITSSQLVYAFRNSSGTWNAYDVGAIWSAGVYSLGMGMNQTSAAFCPTDGGFMTMNLLQTATNAGTVQLLKCTPDATGGCPDAASWTAQSVSAGLGVGANPGSVAAGIGGGRQAMAIRSDGRVIIASTDGTLGIKAAISTQTCSTAPAGLSWTAAATHITTANAGVSGFDLALTSTEAIVFYGISTTSVSYAKTALDLSTGFTAGNTLSLETVTMGNDGVHLVYDSTNDTLWGSHAALPGAAAGAAGNDIKVSSPLPADIVSTGAQIPYTVVDQTTMMFPVTAAPSIAAAKSSSGRVGYAYFYTDNGATPSATSRLYFGEKQGTSSSPYFAANLVYNFADGGASTNYAGQHLSLAYDSSNNPFIAFVDSSSGNGSLMVARSNNQGASFAVDLVDGQGAGATVGHFSSIAMYGSVAGVAYYDYTGGTTGLKFARWKPGQGWRRYVVDGMTGATGSGCSTTETAGKFATLKWTSTGRPVIAYQSNPSTFIGLKIAYATEASTSSTYTWTCVSVDSSPTNQRGEGIDFQLTSSDVIHLIHMDTTQSAARYVTCSSGIATCISSGSSAFSSERISLVGSVGSVSSRPSIQVTSAGKRYTVFYSQADAAMMLASKAASDSLWTTEIIDAPVNGVGFVSASGQYTTMLLNSSELPMIFYRSLENWLKYFSREYL